MVQRVIGFLGPNGALPIHLSEYALDRKLHSADETFTRFLDILLHRFGLFFYRAWARSQPTVSLDREDESPLIRHVGAWIGLGEQRARRRDALGDFPKLFFVGRLSRQVRDADGLAAWLTSHLGVAARVEQFCGHWMRLERPQRSRLMRLGQHGVGRGAVLGESVECSTSSDRDRPPALGSFLAAVARTGRHQPASRIGSAVRRLRVRLGPAPGARARRRAALGTRRPPRSADWHLGSHGLDCGAGRAASHRRCARPRHERGKHSNRARRWRLEHQGGVVS